MVSAPSEVVSQISAINSMKDFVRRFMGENNFCRCFTQVFVLSTKQDSAHNFLSSTLGSRFGSGSWPLSLVSDTEPIVGSGLKSTRDRLRDQTDSKSISKRSLRHKGMDNISNLKPIQF